jgi:hypothetical protein
MISRSINIAIAGALASGLAFAVLPSASAFAQGAHNCNNVLSPECSNSPNAPASGLSKWSPPNVGGGSRHIHSKDVRTL